MLEGEVSPAVPAAGTRSFGSARVLLPAALSLLVLAALVAIVLLVRRNSEYLDKNDNYSINLDCLTEDKTKE